MGEQTLRLASVTLEVVRSLTKSASHAKSPHTGNFNEHVQDYVERHLMGDREGLKSHKYAVHFEKSFANFDAKSTSRAAECGSCCCRHRGGHDRHPSAQPRMKRELSKRVR